MKSTTMLTKPLTLTFTALTTQRESKIVYCGLEFFAKVHETFTKVTMNDIEKNKSPAPASHKKAAEMIRSEVIH